MDKMDQAIEDGFVLRSVLLQVSNALGHRVV